MIPETLLYNAVFKFLQANQNAAPKADKYAQIYMAAGMSPKYSREENICRLCDYLGVDTEEECIEELSRDIQNFDIEILLKKKQMFTGRAEQLVGAIEQIWFAYLSFQFDKLKETYNSSSILHKYLVDIYEHVTPIHGILTTEIDGYMRILRPDVLVGIIADHLAMSFNNYINTCGYYSISDEQKNNIHNLNNILNFCNHEDELELKPTIHGIELLAQLDKANKELTSVQQQEEQPPHEILIHLPQYKNRWQWEQRFLAMLLLQCNLKDEDLLSPEQIAANNKMKEIIQMLLPLLPNSTKEEIKLSKEEIKNLPTERQTTILNIIKIIEKLG